MLDYTVSDYINLYRVILCHKNYIKRYYILSDYSEIYIYYIRVYCARLIYILNAKNKFLTNKKNIRIIKGIKKNIQFMTNRFR